MRDKADKMSLLAYLTVPAAIFLYAALSRTPSQHTTVASTVFQFTAVLSL